VARKSLQRLVFKVSGCIVSFPPQLTLIKPPSGFALRNAGWALTFGCKSVIDLIFVNSGTGPLPGGPVDCGTGRRGDFGSLPNTAFNCAVAELGKPSLLEEYGVIGGNC
jgi:hypothetical protein